MNKVIIEDIRKQDFRYAEAIKTLQTNIQFAGKNTKVVMITKIEGGKEMNKVIIEDIRKQDFRYAEAIKTLQTNIQFAGKNTKVVMITSCFPNEGKSDIALSLAKEMAASGKRVLLLDADIRKSSFVSRFRIQEKVYGLSQYLSGQITPQDLIYMTNYHNQDSGKGLWFVSVFKWTDYSSGFNLYDQLPQYEYDFFRTICAKSNKFTWG